MATFGGRSNYYSSKGEHEEKSVQQKVHVGRRMQADGQVKQIHPLFMSSTLSPDSSSTAACSVKLVSVVLMTGFGLK